MLKLVVAVCCIAAPSFRHHASAVHYDAVPEASHCGT